MIIDFVVVGGANVIFITLLRRRTAHFSSKNFPDVIRDCFQLFVAVVISPSWSLSRKSVLSITITTTSITICERRRGVGSGKFIFLLLFRFFFFFVFLFFFIF
jgi:hypothetical protein